MLLSRRKILENRTTSESLDRVIESLPQLFWFSPQ